MAEIIQFPQKKEEVRQYSFNINKENYILLYYMDRNLVSYAAMEINGEEISTKALSKEENKRLYDETFNFFFLQVEDEKKPNETLPYALLVYFDFEGEKYATYYLDEDDAENEPMLIFQIVDKKVVKMENPFQIRKVVNHFEENFRVEWFQ